MKERKKKLIKVMTMSLLTSFFIMLTGCNFLTSAVTNVIFSEKIEIYDYEELNAGNTTVSISKGKTDGNPYIALENRGIIFNKEDKGQIKEITLNVSGDSNIYLYLSKTPLGIDESIKLDSGDNVITPNDDYGYFVIQNEGETNNISNLNVTTDSSIVHEWEYDDFPSLDIRTTNSQGVYSKTSYVDCTIFATEEDEEGRSGSFVRITA